MSWLVPTTPGRLDTSLRCFFGWHRGCHGIVRLAFSKEWTRYCPCKCHRKETVASNR